MGEEITTHYGSSYCEHFLLLNCDGAQISQLATRTRIACVPRASVEERAGMLLVQARKRAKHSSLPYSGTTSLTHPLARARTMSLRHL
jgi:hypothetical protein